MNKTELFISISLQNVRLKNEFLADFRDNHAWSDLESKYNGFLIHEKARVTEIVDYCLKENVEIVCFYDEYYPPLLKQIPDAPLVLFAKGNKELLRSGYNIAIVGTRRATKYGSQQAYQLAQQLTLYGVAVVSGLAEGIDAAAHQGALDANGKTIAVIGTGIAFKFPAINAQLYDLIYEKGVVITEYPPFFPASKATFPSRNRIIAGLSRAVVIAESLERGGSMITAQLALDYDREVFAIPGRITDEFSKGPNLLIKQGAVLVQDSADVMNAMNWMIPPQAVKTEIKYVLGEAEKKVYDLLGPEPFYIDKIAFKSGLRASQVISVLAFLEMQGLVKELPGKNYIKI